MVPGFTRTDLGSSVAREPSAPGEYRRRCFPKECRRRGKKNSRRCGQGSQTEGRLERSRKIAPANRPAEEVRGRALLQSARPGFSGGPAAYWLATIAVNVPFFRSLIAPPWQKSGTVMEKAVLEIGAALFCATVKLASGMLTIRGALPRWCSLR